MHTFFGDLLSGRSRRTKRSEGEKIVLMPPRSSEGKSSQLNKYCTLAQIENWSPANAKRRLKERKATKLERNNNNCAQLAKKKNDSQKANKCMAIVYRYC